MQVLVVDDNITVLNMLKALLSNEGMMVDVAASGKEAIHLVSNLDYNVIIMDLQVSENVLFAIIINHQENVGVAYVYLFVCMYVCMYLHKIAAKRFNLEHSIFLQKVRHVNS